MGAENRVSKTSLFKEDSLPDAQIKNRLSVSRILQRFTAGTRRCCCRTPTITAAAIFGASLLIAFGDAQLHRRRQGLNSAMTAAGIKTIVTSRQFLEKGQTDPHLPEQVPQANWVYLEDLKDTVTLADKL